MISKRNLLDRIKVLERRETLSVPVVDEDGERVIKGIQVSGHLIRYLYKDISFKDVCKALQEMCGIEITYQEIKGSEGVVIYEKEDD